MPWKVNTTVSQRKEFVLLAGIDGANVRLLCQRFGISPTTGYKWLDRAEDPSPDRFVDRSRRPHYSPGRTPPEIEQLVLELRQRHPAWGGRKLRRRLQDLGNETVPSASTITAVLQRHGCIKPEESAARTRYIRFEHPHPNDLWQMDFKGDVPTGTGRCYPLTVLDDHSRFLLTLEACWGPCTEPTMAALERTFRRYGLPRRMTMDNGSPFAAYQHGRSWHTAFAAWLIRLGIRVSHSRPKHPQTQGKDERLHRSLKVEVLSGRTWTSVEQCQPAFDEWRHIYNIERPHQALGLAVPASRYQPSPRSFPDRLPEIEYPEGEIVRKVQKRGQVFFHTDRYWVGKAFEGQPVAIRPTNQDGVYDVYYCHQRVAAIDRRSVRSPQ